MKQFKRRKSEAFFLALCSVACFAFVFLPSSNPTKTLFVDLVFLGIGSFALFAFIQSLVVIALTDYSITIKYPLLSEREISLSDIYSFGDSNAPQRLVLRDFHGKTIATIPKSVVGILVLKEELKRIVADRIKIEPKDYFVRANSYFISLISLPVVMVGTIILSAYTRTMSIFNTFLLLASMLYLIYSIGKQTIFVHLNDSSIILESLFNKRIISMIEIEKIVQKLNDKVKNSTMTVVMIEMKQSKAIRLSGFKPDDELLFQSCKYYFDNKRCAT